MANQTLAVENTDIEIIAELEDAALTVRILKAGCCVHTVVIDNIVERMEHAWLADCLAGPEHVDLRALEGEAFDYLVKTNTNQG